MTTNVSVREFKEYRFFLAAILREKKGGRYKYSLRAMARDLGVSPAFLSLVLSGKRRFSTGKMAKLVVTLKLRGEDAEIFLRMDQ